MSQNKAADDAEKNVADDGSGSHGGTGGLVNSMLGHFSNLDEVGVHFAHRGPATRAENSLASTVQKNEGI